MNEVSHENQPTYEELLEFQRKHLGWLDEYRAQASRRAAAEKECQANLSRTWTGRLVLLAHKLDMDYFGALSWATFFAVNFWIAVIVVARCFAS